MSLLTQSQVFRFCYLGNMPQVILKTVMIMMHRQLSFVARGYNFV